MAYAVSSDPVRFDEAIGWFKSKLGSVVTRADWDALDARAKRRAFFVSGTARLDVIQHAWELVDRALEQGTDFREFQAAAATALGEAWLAADAGRLETIFRNNVQSAYAAGRYQQQTTPEALAQHPVWMFDAVLDGRTTEVCQACNGARLPADSPFWASHVPPLHHRCRSGIITLSSATAKKLGGLTDAPTVDAQEGWGDPPARDEWQPAPATYAPEIQHAVHNLIANAPPAP